ncbi:MAG: ElyC/SanA/YdcF family protein [Verrucomicrobiota bacterium]
MQKLIQLFKKLSLLLTAIVLLGILTATAINFWVLWRGSRHLLSSIEQIPVGSIGVVLGTSPGGGKHLVINPFFEARMDAAATLYHSGTVYHLVLSGDNRRADYNEPSSMKEALKHRGVPASALTLDYAGFRTLDTVARAHRVFQVQKPVIITDDFHIARALFLAEAEGAEALGFASAPIPWRRSYKTRVREWASRVRAFLDVYILGTQPHFLGETIQLPQPSTPETADPTE